MKEKFELPTLSDSDIVTNDDSKVRKVSNPMKLSTIAMALMLTTASSTMLSSCSDNSDCDSDATKYADPLADAFDTGGGSDTTDADVSKTADAKPCD